MVFFERTVTNPLGDRLFKDDHRRSFGFGRAVAIILAELLMLFIVGALLFMPVAVLGPIADHLSVMR